MAAESLATLNGLMKATQTEVELPAAAAALLSRTTVTIRRIAGSTFRALFPPRPAELMALIRALPPTLEGPALVEAIQQCELRWIEEALPGARVRYRVELEEVKYRALARALVEPRMTEEEVERLGDDIDPVYVRLLEFSGLIPSAPAATEEAPAREPAAA
jgi:hypothetical protein